MDITLPTQDPLGPPTQELERALKLILPSLRDHAEVATTLRMMLQRRGFDVVKRP
jgi:hypothetical protein